MRTIKIFAVIKGLIKGLPGIGYFKNFYDGGATLDARYCYSVWLRHLVLAYENGFAAVPQRIAELGPGNSLGVGIAALISGADQYFAFDIVRHPQAEVNLKIFDELVELFKNQAPIPDEREFPKIKPALSDYAFPTNIFNPSYLNIILNENRLVKIRRSIEALKSKKNTEGENMINYVVPWNSKSLIKCGYLDMILSQAVIQHIDDIE